MRVIITGGGTGGHIYPAIAICKKIQSSYGNDARILYIGAKNGMERDLVIKEQIPYESIRVMGFRRKLSLQTFKALFALWAGLFQSYKLVKKFKPDLVVGTGGYVCGPVIFVAALMGIKTIIHEQNAYPGVTNRILGRFVTCILISYQDSAKYFKNDNKILYTGNPVREEFTFVDREACREKLQLKPDEKLIISVGGSGGAEKLNHLMREVCREFNGMEKIKIIHVTGKKYYQIFMEDLKRFQIDLDKNIKIYPYSTEMHVLYGAADLAIVRGGAITLAEIGTVGVPVIIIPSPNVANNHQECNARHFQECGAAEVLLEKDLGTVQPLMEMIEKLLAHPHLLASMRTAGTGMFKQNALNSIMAIVFDLGTRL